MATNGLLGGRYRLDHVAGHGGMATVFVAYDTVLERSVAIKLLQRRSDAGGVLHERFRREAVAEARIVHPNVIAVHDVGENEDGRPFIVMDYVEGRSLQEVLADHALSSERAAAIGGAIARALAVAHERGIVHRDIKPGNILIDDQGIPHLTDFGLARLDDQASLELTVPGELLGTVLYVAPEQARNGDVGPAADIYALGATLYHVVAGEPPFSGKGPIDTALQRFEGEPPPLAERVPDVDPELAGLIHAMLAFDPAARPADAGPLAERFFDISARLRTRRLATEPAPPPVGAPSRESTPGASAAAAAEIPKPNAQMLPADPISPVARDDG
ncbi:hypothetical protein WPS_15390 [Vulcanimicrobium alpinum]|uniref:non-specific serine/threonine protein kinase n=1 Tax=Vulcanimicrobium alpinum TaxID=3016050 RepID=A0AAN1XXN9_UNVUL|nr:serine/threonine-protein kinase [Vulcanimicrobium alpinum]BDE06263.1 hypothetical protein WPS_15390 [Vulcanimicrobium alpinum]